MYKIREIGGGSSFRRLSGVSLKASHRSVQLSLSLSLSHTHTHTHTHTLLDSDLSLSRWKSSFLDMYQNWLCTLVNHRLDEFWRLGIWALIDLPWWIVYLSKCSSSGIEANRLGNIGNTDTKVTWRCSTCLATSTTSTFAGSSWRFSLMWTAQWLGKWTPFVHRHILNKT